jgi:ubiquinone/menaquinone biosynthesis C-methylase UbiE
MIRGADENWYSSGYRDCYYSGFLGFTYNLVHKIMEQPYGTDAHFDKILELGAGNGEHFPFVKHSYSEYFMTDIRLENLKQFERTPKVSLGKLDCTNLVEIADNSIDRVVATCLLVHVNTPFMALQEWRRVVKPGGVLTFYLAPEPGLLVRIVRKLFIWPKSKAKGASNPKLLAYSEHINHYPGMRTFVEEIFANDKVTFKRYPIRFLTWNFCLFEIVHVTKNH